MYLVVYVYIPTLSADENQSGCHVNLSLDAYPGSVCLRGSKAFDKTACGYAACQKRSAMKSIWASPILVGDEIEGAR